MIVAVALFALLPGVSTRSEIAGSPHLEEVLAAVAQTRNFGLESHDETVRQLVGLGPDVVQAVLEVITGRLDLGPDFDPTLDADSRDVLVDVLRELPRDRVGVRLLELAAAGDPSSDPLTALNLLGRVGDTRALLGLLEIYANAEANWLRGRRLQSGIEGATRGVLNREPDALHRIDVQLLRLEGEILRPVVRALGRLDVPGADEVLVDLLGRGDDLDSIVLAALAECGLRTLPGRESRLAVLRGFLMAPDPTVRRQATIVLGRLRDAESVESLVMLLGEDRWGMDRAAHDALCAITGLDLGRGPEAWERWLADELRWHAEDCDELIETMHFGEPADALRAIRELSSRPLFAPELSRELALMLRHQRVGLAAAAAVAIRRLGDLGACTDLIDALEDRRQKVRAEAHATLVELLGVDLGDFADAWRVSLSI